MEVRNGQMTVVSQYNRMGKAIGEEVTKEDLITVDAFETIPATIDAKLGMTVNLGNYESMRVDVGVSLPCYKEEISKAQDFAFKLAEKVLFAKVKEVKETMSFMK